MMRFIFLMSMLLIGNNSFASLWCKDKECAPKVCQKSTSVYIPRQMAYDPVYQNALKYEKKNITDEDWSDEDWSCAFSADFFATKSTGKNLDTYFNIDNKDKLLVRELGTRDIDSLWFQDIASFNPVKFFGSQLTMRPERVTYGAFISFDANLTNNIRLEIFTALIKARHQVNLHENFIENPGILPNIANISDSFASPNRKYGKILPKTMTKGGLDDIQIKLAKFYEQDSSQQSIYLLFGIPTGKGTESEFLFEPLVGSKHFNLGAGVTFDRTLIANDNYNLNLLGEVKWRYGLQATEKRSFDLTKNGQWSRYMLVADKEDKDTPYFAINNLTLDAEVTPRNNLDVWLALNTRRCEKHSIEVGYNFWYRQQEKVCVKPSCNQFDKVFGVADLLGIAKSKPQSASTANISQSIEPGTNQMTSDATFIPITITDLNMQSGAQKRSITHKVYLSYGYNFFWGSRDAEITFNTSYEFASKNSMLNQVAFWTGFNFLF